MQRYQMKQLLAEQEKQHPTLFASLLTAMRPLMGATSPPPQAGEGVGEREAPPATT
jgi:hypothetical protein